MSRAILLWAILATLLAGFFIWRYEKKECIQTTIQNIVDTAVIYIPIQPGAAPNLQFSGAPGLNLPVFPQKNFIVGPQVSFGSRTTLGIGGSYLMDKWTINYSYDFMRKSHIFGVGYRF